MRPRISLIISSAAFAISAAGFYFGTFYEHHELRQTVTAVEPHAAGIKFVIAAVNAGTQHGVILDIEPTILQETKSASEWVRLPYEGFQPVAVPPSDIRLIEVPAAIDFGVYAGDSRFGRSVSNSDVEVIVGMTVTAMNAQGAQFVREYPVLYARMGPSSDHNDISMRRRVINGEAQNVFAAAVLSPEPSAAR